MNFSMHCSWLARDPVTRLRAYLGRRGLLEAAAHAELEAQAEAAAAELRRRMQAGLRRDPADLFRYVYAEPTPGLRRQRQELAAELAAQQEAGTSDDRDR